ncbi:hypothetical protein RHMOL_Rhmol08G0123600 [Rhododendron molle]|uniref:Uncharacterized protein n=1 Tax=Rhododendron molle TaxID=49168 RepID=A0ACC0MMG8_RHOML|nr:hypothetical protein RHMOL_Rhmol08G0123600 [Rhododendron molle]
MKSSSSTAAIHPEHGNPHLRIRTLTGGRRCRPNCVIVVAMNQYRFYTALLLATFPSIFQDLSFREIFCGYRLWFGLSNIAKCKEPFPLLHEYTDQQHFLEGALNFYNLLRIVHEVLAHLRLAPGQLMPNAWKIFYGAIVAFKELGKLGRSMMEMEVVGPVTPGINSVWGDSNLNEIENIHPEANDIEDIVKTIKKKSIGYSELVTPETLYSRLLDHNPNGNFQTLP